MEFTEIEKDVASAGDQANAVTISNLLQSLQSARRSLEDGSAEASHTDFIMRVTCARYPSLRLLNSEHKTASDPIGG